VTRRALAPMLAWLVAAGCNFPAQDPPEKPLPLCVDGFRTGQVLSLELGVPYDADSDYVYDDSFLRGTGGTSCDGIDGLAPSTLLTLTPDTELSIADVAAWGYACAPLGMFEPASISSNTDLTGAELKPVPGVTIDTAFMQTQFHGEKAYSIITLFTPSMDATGSLTSREVPPLVVSRVIVNDGYTDGCSDVWVATWNTPP
jgi:hypothetical protein